MFVFYLIGGLVSGVVGVAIGNWRKQPPLGAFLVSFLLGPIGWLFVAVSTPDRKRFRDCPACMSPVPREATACAHCGRDLPPAPAPQRSSGDNALTVALIGLIVVVFAAIFMIAVTS